ncbi:Asp-tRNA(Asn)/Glu-tRNA(Gln) amidotransferase subunit GatB [Kiritimatiella glycovorans]|uniref:Aspartyl/glutamyl-tRNA(Asn/Gln) amidotransferase subunit B n=1 Tax=Kiritimatiella glycovorans TaxID=1307763 RepID=A0A0G3EFX4_9BACT|nr:Asp-tRNA(Asn)/Glu-tRNA(Gln) amidotransferase subunit GatB [Kiritimatiella glycovorans]AKJ65321.1 Aspartyl/glutamyl-tRNA(Asn/Gln) amidotransferase subunit B [Kiritimatiella glycovorans]
MNYEAVIGLEVHVQLRTRTKIFCGCRVHDEEAAPNTHVCPVCLGYPGALPVLNARAVELCCRAGLMLDCTLNRISKWDRKNYFYPDMPKNYQISQYDLPLCLGGRVEAEVGGEHRSFPLTRIHLEEDVAKNTHVGTASLIDFNRAGTPLMEIVSEPCMQTPDDAMAFLTGLKQILQYGGISDCDLEKGNMRCDINVSVRPQGETKLGIKAEIKNMNTFKGVHNALEYEIRRQIDELGRGLTLRQETRRWDPDSATTSAMRTKEEAHDYRYFPEPDLLPVQLSEEGIEAWRADLPELPAHRRERYVSELGLPEYDAGVLAADKAVADFFDAALEAGAAPKAASNWLMGEMLRLLSEEDRTIGDASVTPEHLAELIRMIDEKTISHSAAKEVFETLFREGGDPRAIVEERGMAQVSEDSALEPWADQVIAENPGPAEDYRNGKEASINFLMGQVMKLSRGKANPPAVIEILKKKLGG